MGKNNALRIAVALAIVAHGLLFAYFYALGVIAEQLLNR